MEIQQLVLRLTDRDLESLASRAARGAEEVQDLKASFTPEGVVVTGKYPTSFLTVGFETTWSVEASGPELRVTLAGLKVMGVPGGFLRGILLRMARDLVADEPGVRVEESSVVITPSRMAEAQGVPLDVHFTRVALSVGEAVLEAGGAPS
jgi:hypothetical protein